MKSELDVSMEKDEAKTKFINSSAELLKSLKKVVEIFAVYLEKELEDENKKK